MKRNVGLTYGDFEFPAEQGFTGSRGAKSVKGYMRGGKVTKANQTMPKNVKKHGGVVKKAMGGFMGPEREITVDDVTISTPRAKGGRVGKKHGGKVSMHDKLKSEGAKLGFKHGGQVKNTSPQFKTKRGKQKTMDTGVQPARRGRNQAEIEAGGTKRMLPGLNKGGLAAHVAKARGGSVKK